MSVAPYENPDLKRERQNCPFNREEITNLLDGGAQETKERRELENYILSDPQLKDPIPLEYLSHADRYVAELRKACHLMTKLRNSPSSQPMKPNAETLYSVIKKSDMVLKDGQPLGLHWIMFIPTLAGQGTKEQQEKWLPRAYNLDIIGTYAQSELGHGTFLRGLETKATYDPTTKEFILETPSLSAFKWWPGELGKTANYAIVMAQLYTKGKCEGLHPFLVQLRNEKNHEPLPGIQVGEIGPLMGMNSNGSGFLGFDHVRIPRDQLLMKNSQVLEDGTYVKSVNDKLSYATMVFVRVLVVQEMTRIAAKACTIATRYSCVRHQSELKPGAAEPQIMDYQAQQDKLFPPLASVFGFNFAAQHVANLYQTASERIEKGDLQLLPDLHGLSCALKALCTSETANFVDVLRRSCGGHGFMQASNFPRLFAMVTASETYEGENTVLWLQVARYLVKAAMDRVGGESVAYLVTPCEEEVVIDLSLDCLVVLFEEVAIGLVNNAVKQLQSCIQRGQAPHDAWNSSAVALIRAAKSHARYLVVECYVRSIKSRQLSEPVRLILFQLCELFLIYWLMENKGDFILHAGVTKEHLEQLEARYSDLLLAIRPQAVNLVDAFDLRDEILNSAIGCWDGNVYQRLFDGAAKSPMNKTAVHKESYENILRPLMLKTNSKL